MKGEHVLRRMSLLALLWIFNAQGVFKLTEAKSLDNLKEGIPPNITEHPVGKSIKKGKGLSLVCAAAGEPKPRIIWKKNGKKISEDQRVKIRPIGWGSKLRIRDAVPQDSGYYHCMAKNKYGFQSSSKARVEVRGNWNCSQRGSCKPYIGSICTKYISNDSKVFVPHLKSQKQSEENIARAISILTDYMHPACQKSLVKALCYSLFPPRKIGNHLRPRLLCKDQCEVLKHRTCSKEVKLLETKLGHLANETIPNCPELSRDSGDCLSIVKKTKPGRGTCETYSDVPEVMIKPLKKSSPICSEMGTDSGKRVKIYNREIFKLVRNVKSKIQNGRMLLTSQSNELSTYCFSASLPINNLVREWDFYYRTRLLPNLQWPYNITVPGLTISTRNSSVDAVLIPLGSVEKYKVHEKIILKNVAFSYRYRSGHGSFIAEGEFNLCETVFKLTVETLSDGTVKLAGSSETPIDVSTIEREFITAQPSNWLVKMLKRTDLFVLRLKRPVMEAYITKDLIVKFSGETYFGADALPVSLELFGGKWNRNDVLLAGITSPHLTMNQALKLFTGFTIPYLEFLKTPFNGSSVGMVLSANVLDLRETPYGRLEQQPLSLAFAGTVAGDLSLVTKAMIPTETDNSSQVCQLFQSIFGRGREFIVQASTSADSNGLTLDWHFHDISKRAITSFDRVEMKMKIAGTSSSILPNLAISVDGRFYSSEQRSKSLPFSGQLSFQDHKGFLEGNFETQSEWKKAFGIEYLTMKNVRLGVSLPTNRSLQSKIRGEADLQLGTNCHNGENDSIKQRCVTGNLYLGFSDVASDHFFYGTLSPVSLQKLLELNNIQHKLPGAMATIGFPEGLQISVAREEHDLSEFGGPVLQAGFLMKGKMSVLGIETTGAISLSPKQFLIDAKLMSDEAPATVDDVTPLLLTRSDRAHSPKLFLKARMDPVPFVKAHVDGYARLFGIFEEASILVTGDSLQIYLTTDVSKSFKINVHITTNYSSNRNDTQFNAMVVFDSGLSKLTRLASKQVVAMLEQEMSELRAAKGEVQRMRRECVRTIKRDCASCIGNRDCAGSLGSCSSNTGIKTPNSSEDKRNAIDICQRFVMERCLATETACYNACRFVSLKANKTCAAYNAAAVTQRKLERGLRWVKQAEQFMDGDLFQIHAISFKTNVTSAINLEQLYLDTSLEVTIFGQRQKLEGLRMEFNKFVKLSSEIAKYAWDWYQKTQPQSKPKSLHPDNRPRPPPS